LSGRPAWHPPACLSASAPRVLELRIEIRLAAGIGELGFDVQPQGEIRILLRKFFCLAFMISVTLRIWKSGAGGRGKRLLFELIEASSAPWYFT